MVDLLKWKRLNEFSRMISWKPDYACPIHGGICFAWNLSRVKFVYKAEYYIAAAAIWIKLSQRTFHLINTIWLLDFRNFSTHYFLGKNGNTFCEVEEIVTGYKIRKHLDLHWLPIMPRFLEYNFKRSYLALHGSVIASMTHSGVELRTEIVR